MRSTIFIPGPELLNKNNFNTGQLHHEDSQIQSGYVCPSTTVHWPSLPWSFPKTLFIARAAESLYYTSKTIKNGLQIRYFSPVTDNSV